MKLTRHGESWITKDCDSRGFWRGEGLPSRDLDQNKRDRKRAAEGSVTTDSEGILV